MKSTYRFAPSPTGFLHIGGLRTAIYNYLLAKKNGGKFILRIEDTDKTRFVPEAENYIKESFKWLGMIPDESPWTNENYRQSERTYPEINVLLEKGFAYYCFATPEEIKERLTEGRPYNSTTRNLFRNSLTLSETETQKLLAIGATHTVRFKTPNSTLVTIEDTVKGKITFHTSEMDDKILIKSDGSPSFHLANTVDDINMGVTHVIRGDEWIPSTPLHCLIYDALEHPRPTFSHLGIITDENGKKLSKRDAIERGLPIFPLTPPETDILGFRERGFEPIAVFNFLALLGCSFNQKEMMTLQEMIDNIEIKHFSSSPSKYLIDKLHWFNAEHLRRTDYTILWNRVNELGVFDTTGFTSTQLEMMMEEALSRSTMFSDIITNLDMFFHHEVTKDVSDATKELLKNRPIAYTLESATEYVGKFKNKMELREVLCSSKRGTDLITFLTIMGAERVNERMDKYL